MGDIASKMQQPGGLSHAVGDWGMQALRPTTGNWRRLRLMSSKLPVDLIATIRELSRPSAVTHR